MTRTNREVYEFFCALMGARTIHLVARAAFHALGRIARKKTTKHIVCLPIRQETAKWKCEGNVQSSQAMQTFELSPLM